MSYSSHRAEDWPWIPERKGWLCAQGRCLCRAFGRVKERMMRINKTPLINFPKARGSLDTAMDSICVR